MTDAENKDDKISPTKLSKGYLYRVNLTTYVSWSDRHLKSLLFDIATGQFANNLEFFSLTL